MSDEHPIDRMAKSIGAWAFCDSSVQLDPAQLRACLGDDAAASGRTLSEAECEVFICGDETGEVPASLIADYPKTHAYIGGFW